MSTSLQHNVTPPALLNILAENIDIVNQDKSQLDSPNAQKKITTLIQALNELNNYFLLSPERLNVDFKKYILQIFKNPPSKEIMDICSQCIVTALKSKVSSVIEPSDFTFSTVIDHVKTKKYSDETIVNLLEIIFTISDVKANEIANAKSDDIDIFFNYYSKFDQPSKISCLKCINNIVSRQVYERFFIFLIDLLDIASNSEVKSSIYKYSIQAFITISKFLNKSTIVKKENYQPSEYCQKLCLFISNYHNLEYLDTFIDSIRVCVISFSFTIQTVFRYIKLTSFFVNIEKIEVLKAAIRLVLALMPQPKGDLIDLYPENEFKWTTVSNYELSIEQIKEVVPLIIEIYYKNLSLSKLCLQALAVFVNSDGFKIVLPVPIIYMMFFQSNKLNYIPYILSVIDPCIKIEENRHPILQLNLIERISEVIKDNNQMGHYNYCEKLINTLKPISLSANVNHSKTDFKELVELFDAVKSGELSPFDLMTTFTDTPKNAPSYFKAIKKFFEPFKNLNGILSDCKIFVSFLLKMLADIPIPLIYPDPFYPKYDLMNVEIEFTSERNNEVKKFSILSLLSEFNERNVSPGDILKHVQNDKDIKPIFDASNLKQQSRYLFDILHRELSRENRRQVVINDIPINDEDQFIVTILPQILSPFLGNPVDLLEPENIINLQDCIEKNRFKIKSDTLKNAQVSKSKDLVLNLHLFEGNEIVQEILDLLSVIHSKDVNGEIEFVYKPFIQKIQSQLNLFFLSLGLYSPCSQIMVKYPFLFDLDNRLFLFQLQIKEPLFARDLFLRRVLPDYRPEKKDPIVNIKFTLHRDRLFKEGLIILERFAKYRAFLEIAFEGDEGFGKGPTREFFHKMSKEFCKKRHRIWNRTNFSRDLGSSNVNEELRIYSHNSKGLFPYATASSRYMRALGIFIAKAIQMEQVVDIPFNPAFFDLACDREIKLSDVDESLANSLYDESTPETLAEIEQPFTIVIESKTFDLVQNGSEITVTTNNFDLYKKAVEDFVIGAHVKKKIDCFVNGFAEVLDPSLLKMFSGSEILDILNGKRELITMSDLSKYLVCQTGYKADSEQITYLKEIVTEMDKEHQKYFLQYVTGSPYLPIGGFGALNPPITVVMRKSNEKKYQDEDYWPTANTCVNKFNLPPYKTKEEMRIAIMKAIEYRESFGLT